MTPFNLFSRIIVGSKIGSSIILHLVIRNLLIVIISQQIQLQSKGTVLDIELDEKELSFGRILLYRIEYRTLTIRNKTPVPFFWYLEAEEPADPQITFTPFHGVIETRSEQKIEFCYHATTVTCVSLISTN